MSRLVLVQPKKIWNLKTWKIYDWIGNRVERATKYRKNLFVEYDASVTQRKCYVYESFVFVIV